MRVSYSRNVREDGVFKFVKDESLIDNIVESFTIDELVCYLENFNYSFNQDYTEENQAKSKHFFTLKNYFKLLGIESFNSLEDLKKGNRFDEVLKKSIKIIISKSSK